MDSSKYTEDYFLRGKEKGLSLYENYRWMPELTIPMAKAIAHHCGIELGQTILDFGCARGYTVKAFRELNYEAYGVDASDWAIKNCDEQVAPFVTYGSRIPPGMDWIVAKDVLEHVEDVTEVIDEMMEQAREGVFVVVPLSLFNHQAYVVPEYEMDITHIHRLCLAEWVRFFLRPGWEVVASYRVVGVKDNYAQHENGNGFITCRRL